MCTRKEEGGKLLTGELAPQIRNVEELVPKVTLEELVDQRLEEIDLRQYLKSKQDDDDDVHCDQRCCKICDDNHTIQFEYHHEEARHRESKEHIERLKELAKKEVWHCICCGYTVENTTWAREPYWSGRDDSKRLFVDHLKSDKHQDRARSIWQKHGGQ